MNEMKIEGYFYMNTNTTDNAIAIQEFQDRCKSVGINADNVTSVVIRDENGIDITMEEDV